MQFKPLKTLLIGGALGGAMLIGAATLGPAGAAEQATTTTAAPSTKTTGDGHDGHGGMHHPQLTDAQKKCLTDAGFTKPATRPTTKPTEAQHTAFLAAAKKCGITIPEGMGMGMGMGHGGHGGMHHPQLTDAQKKCLTDAGFTKPATRPTTKPTEAQHTAFLAAAKKCGIAIPEGMGMGHGGHDGMHGDHGSMHDSVETDANANA